MTVFETRGPGDAETNEPIKFPGNTEERREERMRRRLERLKSGEPEPVTSAEAVDVVEPVKTPPRARRVRSAPSLDDASATDLRTARRRKQAKVAETESPETAPVEIPTPALSRETHRLSWTTLSFLLMVVIPSAISGIYYTFIASPQYQIETQFSVRGSSQASMSTFGLSGLFGSSVQSGDSYIVASYVQSLQLIRDVQQELGVDLRKYYSRDDIDWFYRIDANMPLEKFLDYWQSMTEVSFNSTTGNTTLYLYAFSADDTKAVADAVLKVSEKLVNELSEKNRQQMTKMASKQVDRAEDRLRKVREEIRALRTREKKLDISTIAASETQLTQQLENQIQGLKTRLNALLQSVSEDSPSARMLQKQIKAAEGSLADQKDKIGDPSVSSKKDRPGDDGNVADILNKFEELTVEQGFATQAYTTALAAFETALAEAQKQERYFATFVAPTRPEIALYPTRLLDTFIASLVFLAVWMISQFLYRSFRDHAI